MPLFKEIARRLAWLNRRGQFDRELNDEIHFHVESRADELEREGLSRSEAVRLARREFGPRTTVVEETRSAWQFRRLEDLCGDLRYAARVLRRNPAFALTAICCLALGIGANTTMFSIAMEVLFSAPSCRDPKSLVQLRAGGASSWPAREYRFLRDAGLRDGVAGMNIGEVVNWRTADGTLRLAGTRVTAGFFEVTGVPVAIGRPIQSGDSQVAVATYGFWRRRLGSDPNVVGRRLVLDGEPYTLVGVLPREHRNLAGFGFTPDLYLTMESTEYLLFARLPQGTGVPGARERLEVLCRELDRVYPDSARRRAGHVLVSGVGGLERLRAEAGEGWMQGGLAKAVAFFGMLVAVTGLVLLIACANVSSLLLARALSRSRELAIRASLGGSRGRIVRQLLAESVLLAVCGTGAGLLLNVGLTRLISGRRIPIAFPIEFVIEPDRWLLAYSIALGLLVTLAAGLAPAIKGTRNGIGGVLKGNETQPGTSRWTLRNTLVVAQLALSLVLLSGAWVFVRNLLHASSLNPGFDTGHTLWATFRALPESCTPERFRVLTSVAVERLRVLPGLDSVSLARAVPLQSPYREGGPFLPDTREDAIHAEYNFNAVGPDYFRTMRIPILEGRAFLDSDRQRGPAVAILNENLARRLFGSVSPVGHRIRLPRNREVTVVGIARNSKYFLLGEANPMALYIPWTQHGDGVRFAHFLVRVQGPPETALREVKGKLADLDPMAAVEVRTMRDALQFTLLPSRVGAGVLGGMALLGLVLAAVGLYGVLLYTVSRRIREIGVRIALGATPGRILGTLAGESARLFAAGSAIGVGLSVFAVRPLAVFLVPEVRPADPRNFVVVSGALLLVAAIATISPALRAIRIDPAVALRHDQ